MKKRFGYLFYNHYKYIFEKHGRDAFCVNKEDQFVCRKPEEPIKHIKHITYREESAIQSLIIRGPNALLSTKRRHLLDKYCYGPLKA